jgi:stage IV sporulation protein FB
VFFEPNETPLDLKWRMFGIPVRVHPFFWLVSAFMGWNALDRGIIFLVIWVACVFVSVLVHEMGHVLMGRVFGPRGYIVLYSFGGLAVDVGANCRRWQRILIALAGPFAGFLFFGLVFLINRYSGWEMLARGQRIYVREIMFDLFWINLIWGCVNLLPVWPLDGGHVSRDIITWFAPSRGVQISLVLSIIVAGGIAINVLLAYLDKPHIPELAVGGTYMGIFFAILAVNNFMQLQFESSRRTRPRWNRSDDDGERLPWERDPDWWKKG